MDKWLSLDESKKVSLWVLSLLFVDLSGNIIITNSIIALGFKR